MIHPDEAIALIARFRREPELETVELRQALGRILSVPIRGTMDQPPFDKSAMDGWAWNPVSGASNPDTPLRVRGVIAAGSASIAGDRPNEPLEPGEAVRIMTGAPLPVGASRVQRIEWSRTLESDGRATPGGSASSSGSFVGFTKKESFDNIIRRGENARSGELLLSPRILSAQDIAILAADGRAAVEVARRPVVGVLSTGTELADPGEALSDAAIYDSNRPQILTQLASPAFEIRDLGRLGDDYETTIAAVRSALETCDVLVLSGGVSMGDFDYVPRALKTAGIEELFHGVAMKPGKPTWFGTDGRAFVIGLPGNPVSVFVNTEFLVKELLCTLCGIKYKPLIFPTPAAEDLRRKGTDRVEFLPVRIDREGFHAVPYGGSSGLQALAAADGFVRFEIGCDSIPKGGIELVRLVR